MKTVIQLLVFALVAVSVHAQTNETPYLTKTFKSTSIKSLNVRTSGGSISVTGQSGEAKVEVFVRPNSWNGRDNELTQKQIEERLEDYELSVSQEGSLLTCTAKRKNENSTDWKRSLSISFKITIPENTDTDLQTSGGSIRLANLRGNQQFKTSGGSLKLTNVRGDVKGRTSGGSIQLSDCQNNLDLSTSGGSINAERSSGDLRLTTSGGSITLNSIDGLANVSTSGGSIGGDNIKGELIASTSGGSIKLQQVAASLKATTSGGSVQVDIVSLQKYLELATSAGRISVQMPLNKGIDLDVRGQRVNVATLNNFDGSMEKDYVKGKINGGGIPVRLRANSGAVTINK